MLRTDEKQVFLVYLRMLTILLLLCAIGAFWWSGGLIFLALVAALAMCLVIVGISIFTSRVREHRHLLEDKKYFKKTDLLMWLSFMDEEQERFLEYLDKESLRELIETAERMPNKTTAVYDLIRIMAQKLDAD